MQVPTFSVTMSPQSFYILLALTDKSLHGYGIRDEVAHISRSTVVMAPGTVYVLLKRLISRGWIERVPANDRPKIAARYELTTQGRRRLMLEAARVQELADLARYKLTFARRHLADV